MKLFWHKTNNFGDAISPVILGHFLGEPIEFAEYDVKGKMVSTGSVIHAVQEGDTVWGTGLISRTEMKMPKATFLAVRGPLTKQYCKIKTDVFGDPGLLLPLIYKPKIEIKHKVGIIPHYVDKAFISRSPGIQAMGYVINIQADWKKVVDEILSCELIVSSTLHGIVAAEAYGVNVMWAVWTDQIIGGSFKFEDYFMGTGREGVKPYGPITPIKNLESIQQKLITTLKKHYGKN